MASCQGRLRHLSFLTSALPQRQIISDRNNHHVFFGGVASKYTVDGQYSAPVKRHETPWNPEKKQGMQLFLSSKMQQFQAWNAPSLGLTRGDWGVLWPVAVVQSNYWTFFFNTERHAECCWIFKVLNKLRWRSLIYQSAQESCQTFDGFGSLQKLLNNIPSTWIYPADPSGFLLSKEKFETIQNWHVSTSQYTLHFHNSLMPGPALKNIHQDWSQTFLPPHFRRNLSNHWILWKLQPTPLVAQGANLHIPHPRMQW